jgi:(R,R)-butanediol dehydrogenase/meso-butanediol dehydrogenase/diacetyl reductase
MRVAIFNGPNRPITLEHVPDPTPAPDEVVVKVKRCSICGSDVSMTGDVPFRYATGMPMGHEYAGEVVACGKNVTNVRVGTRVACHPVTGCGHCEACRRGRFRFCAKVRPVFGAFGDYIAVPGAHAISLPASVSFADGALVEPIACGLRALRMAGLKKGDRVLVLGAGSMANAVVYWARALGAGRIIVASRSMHRRDIATAMGADAVISFDDVTPEFLIHQFGELPQIVAECVGKAGFLRKATDYVGPGGTVISLGMCMYDEPILAAACTAKEAKLVFPTGYSMDEFVETVKAFEAGHVRPENMVSHVIALDDLVSVLDKMRAGHKFSKVQVDPNLEASHV